MSNQPNVRMRWRVRASLVVLLGVIPIAHAETSRIEPVSPIRRIEVQQISAVNPVPSSAFVIRALSESTGAAVAGQRVFLGPGADTGYPHVFDEFGFRGFNTQGFVSYDSMGGSSLQYFGVTGADGTAAFSGRYFDPAPSAFIVAAAPEPVAPWVPSTWKFFSIVAVKNVPAGKPSVVLEYFNPTNGNYFITISQAEIDALEAGKFVGWQRSPGAMIAWESQSDAPPGAVPVCRFFSPKFTSHFYTADASECDAVEKNLGDVWILETRNAFYIGVPDKATGDCGSGLQPIHRMFNNRASPNHRYIADAALRNIMTGAGWIAEGYGGERAVMMCTPE